MDSECDKFYELLINCVRSFKSLYDKKHPLYHNKGQKEKNWLEISKQTGKTVEECKNRWKLLRERFTKELKKKNAASGSGACDENEWGYFQILLFLKDFVRPRETRSNDMCSDIICEEPEEIDSTMDNFEFQSSSNTSTGEKRKKKNPFDEACLKFGETLGKLEKSLPSSNEEQDETEALFIKSTISLMKDLPEKVKDVVRTQIFNIVMNARRKYIYKEY